MKNYNIDKITKHKINVMKASIVDNNDNEEWVDCMIGFSTLLVTLIMGWLCLGIYK